jgi:glutathione S-transferase
MMTAMKLYDTIGAPNPRRVRIFLAGKGIDVPREQVNLLKFEQKSDGFRALSARPSAAA